MGRRVIYLIGIALVSLFLFWSPYALNLDKVWGLRFPKEGMSTIVRNYDGPNFIVVARTWYSPDRIEEFGRLFFTGREPIYFAAHYPAYAGLVYLFDLAMPATQALLATTVLSNILMPLGLFFFFKTLLKSDKTAFVLAVVCLFLPGRMMAIRTVAANEPLFIFFVLSSLALATKKKDWLAGLMGAFAVLTRSPGILLLGGYLIAFAIKHYKEPVTLVKRITPYLLIPAALLALWAFYGIAYGSFLAYFQVGGNINLYFPPFQVFNPALPWTNGMWLEDIIYIYLIFSTGILLLRRRFADQAHVWVFGIIYLISIFFVAHRDIARYSLPIAPLVIAGFYEEIKRKEFLWILLLFIVPIYIYAWNFVMQNVMPIADWSAFI